MKALCWHGKSDVRVDNVPDPKIVDQGDIIIRVTATAICGSDLHRSKANFSINNMGIVYE